MTDRAILLVEDDPADEALTVRALKDNSVGNEVIVARDGAEALDYLFCRGKYAGRDPCDLPQVVLLDLKLPKLDGLEVLERIRADARTRSLPVVILTTSNLDEDLDRAYELGVNSFVRKPVDFDSFSKVIRELGMYWMLINLPRPIRRSF